MYLRTHSTFPEPDVLQVFNANLLVEWTIWVPRMPSSPLAGSTGAEGAALLAAQAFTFDPHYYRYYLGFPSGYPLCGLYALTLVSRPSGHCHRAWLRCSRCLWRACLWARFPAGSLVAELGVSSQSGWHAAGSTFRRGQLCLRLPCAAGKRSGNCPPPSTHSHPGAGWAQAEGTGPVRNSKWVQSR